MQTLVASDGVKLRYVVDDFTDPWRTSETLLLLHAAMGSSRRFYAWVPHLARHFRIVRLDLRGHGQSEVPPANGLSIERLAKDVTELLDHLGVAAAHVAGSSAGGILSQYLAIAHPERIRTLASFAATPGMKHHHLDFNTWISAIRSKGVAGFLRETIDMRFAPGQFDPNFVEWFIAEANRTNTEFLTRFVQMMANVDLRGRLGDIRCPTLVVVPGADPIGEMSFYHDLRDRIPNVEFIVYEGMAHNITDALADRCAEELKRFLLKHTSAVAGAALG